MVNKRYEAWLRSKEGALKTLKELRESGRNSDRSSAWIDQLIVRSVRPYKPSALNRQGKVPELGTLRMMVANNEPKEMILEMIDNMMERKGL